MKRVRFLMAGVLLAGLWAGGCGSREMLFNGQDLTGWTLYVAEPGVDVDDVWQVEDGVVQCKGVPNGYMRTEKSYSNYKLHVEWRWTGEPTNSGVLLHANGPDQLWPRCIESQLMAGNAGDFVLIGKDVGMTVGDKDYINIDTPYIIIGKGSPSSENPPGEWNRYDITCRGSSISCFVNGVQKNRGARATLTKGNICLQSEGSPIEFRNIYIERLH
ncbi:MAG: DUF1080 domain-containing protein [Sedimentisphaerales bacterium]|nr:DUF1080 domain-containing protein [Sedimentisphaerales bacterium]